MGGEVGDRIKNNYDQKSSIVASKNNTIFLFRKGWKIKD